MFHSRGHLERSADECCLTTAAPDRRLRLLTSPLLEPRELLLGALSVGPGISVSVHRQPVEELLDLWPATNCLDGAEHCYRLMVGPQSLPWASVAAVNCCIGLMLL